MKTKLFLLITILCFSGEMLGQTTYTWTGAVDGNFATAGNWSPSRTAATNDILQFNSGATVNITAISSVTIGKLLISNNTIVNIPAQASNVTISIGGGASAFSITTGSQLNLTYVLANDTKYVQVAILTGSTGVITGNISAFTKFGTAGAFTAADASGLTFNSPAICTQGAGSTGNIFGNGTNNSVVFSTGTTFAQAGGANPFQKTAPNSVVFFNTGSLFKCLTGASAPTFSGRTYANFEWASTGSQTVTGTGLFTCDNFTVSAGTFNYNMTGQTTAGTGHIINGSINVTGGTLTMAPGSTVGHVFKGNISVSSGATFNLNATGSAATVNFIGSAAAQNVSNAGTLNIGASSKIIIGNTFVSSPTVTFNNSQTISSTTALSVTAGSILATSGTLTFAIGPAINGSFQINQGGWATGGTWTYGSSASLIFNNTSLYTVNNTDVFWPTASGPNYVSVQNGGGITMNSAARTVPTTGTTGTFLLKSGSVAGTTLTLNGLTQIDGGSFTTTPTYGSASILKYNTTYGTFNEWTGGATQGVAAGSGIPANVIVSAGTTTLAGGRGTPGNLTVNSSCGFVLNATSGDLYLGGNLINNGSTWTNNGRAVAFVNTGTSTITASTNPQYFDYLLVNKTSGSVQLSATDLTINSTAGSVLQFLNAGSLDLNGRTLTLNNSGGNILADGTTGGTAKSITSSTAATVAITNNKTASGTASGTLSFGSNIKVLLTGGMNFGSNVSTINGSLQLDSGGFVTTNAPNYATGSYLYYNSGSANGVSAEWTDNVSSGTGVPYNVTIGNGVANSGLTFPSSANYRQVTNNFTLTNATSTFSMGATPGGDLKIKGNFVNNGTFNNSNRAVFFNGGAPQTITGVTTFDYLLMAQSAVSTVTLSNNITVNQLLTFGTGKIVAGSNTVIMGASGSTTGASNNSYIYGKQQYPISATGSKTFDVGGSTLYTPVATDFTTVGTTGNLTAGVTDGDHTDITGAAIDPAKSVNRVWTLTNGGGLAGTYNAVFNFDATDVDAGAITADFIARRKVGGLWYNNTMGTRNALNTQITGATAFGDFQIGEGKGCIWDGTTWSNTSGPTISIEAFIAGAYTTIANGLITAKKLTLESGSLTINSGDVLTIENELINNKTANELVFENTASLLQTNNVTNTGNIKYNRTTSTLGNNYDFVYWGSPVSGQTLSSMWMTTANDTFYTYDPMMVTTDAIQGWQYASPATIMTPGVGYAARTLTGSGSPVWNPSNSWVSKFTGVPVNGDKTVTILKNGAYIDNLIANPYPSAIDFEAVVDDATNAGIITGNAYFWTHNTAGGTVAYASNDYAVYNATIGAGVGSGAPAGSGGNTPDQYIDAAQGFFVEADAGGTLNFYNSHRVSGSNNNFFRTGPSRPQSDKIWLNMTNNQGAFKQQLLAYVQNATNGFDKKYDAKSFDGNSFIDFYSVIPTNNLTIQSRPLPFDNQDIVSLGYKSAIAGNFTISIDHFDGDFVGRNVYLQDNLLNLDYNLSNNPYNFTTAIGTFDNRFVLKYTSALATNSSDYFDSSVVVAKDKNNILKIHSSIEDMKSITIFDLLGRNVYSKDAINAKSFTESNIVLNQQTLIVKITLDNGVMVTKKIVY